METINSIIIQERFNDRSFLFIGGKMIKLNVYHSDGNYMGISYDGTLKEFIKKADKGKTIKLVSDGKEWYINSALILAFEEVK